MRNYNTKFVGKVLMEFDELPSTNDFARNYANQSAAQEGAVIRARKQTSGRGQMGTTWESMPECNLTMSVVLKPSWLRADQQTGLSKAVALAVFDALQDWANREKIDQQIQIKWPNDVLINRQKVCGILIENTINGQNLGVSVVGIGVNVNQTHFSGALSSATSMALVSGKEEDIEQVMRLIFAYLEANYLLLKSEGGAVTLHQHYLQHLLGYQQLMSFVSVPDGRIFEGVIVDVDADGMLCVDRDGVVQKFGLKSIKINP